jgi:hypothetical protein
VGQRVRITARALALAAAIISVAWPVSADDSAFGYFWKNACRNTEALCVAFITGVLDGMQVAAPNQRAFCRPVNALNGQMKDVVVAYLERHPELLHLPVNVLVVQALKEAFP